MTSLRTRLTLWFGIWFILIASAFTVLINHRLETELLQKACNKAYPDLPDWNIRNTLTEAEVDAIAKGAECRDQVKAHLLANPLKPGNQREIEADMLVEGAARLAGEEVRLRQRDGHEPRV